MKYNHNRPLSDFQDNINKLKSAGFNPIAVSQLYFEDVYVFETKKEALLAYNTFEMNNNKWIGEIVGWWYGEDDFNKTIEEYEPKWGCKVLTYKL